MRRRKHLLTLTTLVALISFVPAARAAVWGTENLLPTGMGGFEEASDWGFNGTNRVHSNAAANTGAYSAAIVNSGTSNLSLLSTRTFSTVLNRQHWYNVYTKATGSLSGGYTRGVLYWNWSGTLQYQFTGTLATPGTTAFGQKGVSFRPTGAGVYNDFKIAVNARTGSSTVYFDDLALYREIASPNATSDNLAGSALELGEATSVSLFNAAGSVTEGSSVYNVYFDPDIQISSDDATITNVVWVSDTQVDFDITPTAGGEITLTLTNPYGQKSASYVVSAVPEPATVGLLAIGTLAMLRRRK